MPAKRGAQWLGTLPGFEVAGLSGVPDVVAFLRTLEESSEMPPVAPRGVELDAEPTYMEDSDKTNWDTVVNAGMLTTILKKEFALGTISMKTLSLGDWDDACGEDAKYLIHIRRIDAFHAITSLHRLCVYNTAYIPVSFFKDNVEVSKLLKPVGVPHPTLVCASNKILCLAFALFDKFVAAGAVPGSNQRGLRFDFWSLDADWLSDHHKVYQMRLFASACYVIAWKMEVGNVVLPSAEVYNGLLLFYKMDGNPRKGEDVRTFKRSRPVLDENKVQMRNADGTGRTVEKTMGGDLIDQAELVVLRDCGWHASIDTLVNVVDALLDGKHNEPGWIRLRSLSYDIAVRLTLNTDIVYDENFTLGQGAYLVVGEACLQLGVPFADVPGVQQAEDYQETSQEAVETSKRVRMQ